MGAFCKSEPQSLHHTQTLRPSALRAKPFTREALEEYEDACQLMEERIGLGGGGQGGEAALARARVTRLEAEVMALKKGRSGGEGEEAEVVALRRQIAAMLQGRGSWGERILSAGCGGGAEERFAARVEELEEVRRKYAQALEIIAWVAQFTSIRLERGYWDLSSAAMGCTAHSCPTPSKDSLAARMVLSLFRTPRTVPSLLHPS